MGVMTASVITAPPLWLSPEAGARRENISLLCKELSVALLPDNSKYHL
jgi:hypothetical protein